MRATVLRDAALLKQAGQFVWLSVDTDHLENARYLEMYPMTAWPAFFVIDPASERIVTMWRGGATVAEMLRLLDEGRRSGGATADPAALALAEGERLHDARKPAESARAFKEALSRGGADWPRRAYVVMMLAGELQSAGDVEGCARLMVDEGSKLVRGPSFAAAAAGSLECAVAAAAPWASSARATLAPLVEEALTLDSISADDRADCYRALVEEYQRRGDAARPATEQLLQRWAQFLDEQARTAPSAEARVALDPFRVAVALKLKDPARALPALLASERDLPRDYLPSRKLVIVYRELGRWDDALAASDRALERAGPTNQMRLVLLKERAELQGKRGDRAAARLTLEEAVRFGATLPPRDRLQPTLEALRKTLAAWPK